MYVVFARKYRPQTFEDVVGQQHIARTLQNAVRNNRVAHAYLFCGSRGIGKTTMARILAKALNCVKGPTPDPCGECEACRRISTGDDVDVMEIDGASNTSVEQVRDLRQNVRLAPAHSRFKIYYIDEVHMLSNSAFNALLKTLEEPPPHVKFIFSTTDPQKMPETVKSRCQRFDFRRIDNTDIVEWLKSVCKKEGLKVEDKGLAAIARASRGGMRDALGTLDQVAAFGDEHSLHDVLDVLGAVDGRVLTEMVDALREEDTARALRTLNACLTGGMDVEDFTDQLCEYLRDLLVAGHCGPDDPMLAGAAADGATMAEQAKKFIEDELIYMIQVLREAKLRARRDSTGRIALELAIVKLSRLSDLVPLSQLADAVAGGVPRTDTPRGTPGGQSRNGTPTVADGATKARQIRERLNGARRGNGPRASAKPTEPASAPGKDVANPYGSQAKRNGTVLREVAEDEPGAGMPDLPDGIDEVTYRKIYTSADDPLMAREALGHEALVRAYAEANKTLNLEPVKLERLESEEELDEELVIDAPIEGLEDVD